MESSILFLIKFTSLLILGLPQLHFKLVRPPFSAYPFQSYYCLISLFLFSHRLFPSKISPHNFRLAPTMPYTAKLLEVWRHQYLFISLRVNPQIPPMNRLRKRPVSHFSPSLRCILLIFSFSYISFPQLITFYRQG